MQDAVQIEIIKSTEEGVTIRLPWLEVPVQMNRTFFDERVNAGYFQIKEGVEALENSPELLDQHEQVTQQNIQ